MAVNYQAEIRRIRDEVAPGAERAAAYYLLAQRLAVEQAEARGADAKFRLGTLKIDARARARKEKV